MSYQYLRISRSFLLSLFVLGLGSATQAEDEKIPELKTISGKTFRDVRITNVTPSEVRIMHESGVTRIPLGDLPEDMKTKFGYDPAKAKAHAAATNKAAVEAERKMAEQKEKIKASACFYGRISYIDGDLVVAAAKELVLGDTPPVVSSLQSIGGGGSAVRQSTAPRPPIRDNIYGTFVVTHVPNPSKLADEEAVKWIVFPTNATRKVGTRTYKVLEYLAFEK